MYCPALTLSRCSRDATDGLHGFADGAPARNRRLYRCASEAVGIEHGEATRSCFSSYFTTSGRLRPSSAGTALRSQQVRRAGTTSTARRPRRRRRPALARAAGVDRAFCRSRRPITRGRPLFSVNSPRCASTAAVAVDGGNGCATRRWSLQAAYGFDVEIAPRSISIRRAATPRYQFAPAPRACSSKSCACLTIWSRCRTNS